MTGDLLAGSRRSRAAHRAAETGRGLTVHSLPQLAISHSADHHKLQSQALARHLTEKQTDVPGSAWYARPMPLGLLVLAATLVLNIIFW